MRWLKRVCLGLVIALLVAIAAGQRFGDHSLDPRDNEDTITLQVVDYGYHAALFVPRQALLDFGAEQGDIRLVAVANRFAAYPTLEFGWGDEAFYRQTATIADFQLGLGLSAILGLNDKTVVQVVGWNGTVDAPYPGNARAVITVSKRAFIRMMTPMEASLAGDQTPEELGAGLYGPSLFYRATGRYSLFNVCNHWTAHLMIAAGRPVNLTLATISRFLVWQLQ